jgi:hypothetical protein
MRFLPDHGVFAVRLVLRRELFPGLAGREGKTAPQDQNPSPLPPDPMGRPGCSPLPPDPEAQVGTSPLPPDPHITGNLRTGDR